MLATPVGAHYLRRKARAAFCPFQLIKKLMFSLHACDLGSAIIDGAPCCVESCQIWLLCTQVLHAAVPDMSFFQLFHRKPGSKQQKS